MTYFLGFGGYVPERVMSNEEWAGLLDTSDEWITQRTGIKRRRIADDDESTLTLAANAAGIAIKDAGLTPDDIDEIIVATDTPEMYTPDTAALLQDLLGCRNIPPTTSAARAAPDSSRHSTWPGPESRTPRRTSWWSVWS